MDQLKEVSPGEKIFLDFHFSFFCSADSRHTHMHQTPFDSDRVNIRTSERQLKSFAYFLLKHLLKIHRDLKLRRFSAKIADIHSPRRNKEARPGDTEIEF